MDRAFPFDSGGPQDPQHHNGASNPTYGTGLDDLVETVREGEVSASVGRSFCTFRLQTMQIPVFMSRYFFKRILVRSRGYTSKGRVYLAGFKLGPWRFIFRKEPAAPFMVYHHFCHGFQRQQLSRITVYD